MRLICSHVILSNAYIAIGGVPPIMSLFAGSTCGDVDGLRATVAQLCDIRGGAYSSVTQLFYVVDNVLSLLSFPCVILLSFSFPLVCAQA